MNETFVIGELARRTGVPAKTIRYYEETGLIPAARRGNNGYRRYEDRAVHVLRFIKRARDLGFSVQDVGGLLALWSSETRESSEVKQLAERHLGEIERKIESLVSLRDTLRDLVHRCHGDDRPQCPILDDLGTE